MTMATELRDTCTLMAGAPCGTCIVCRAADTLDKLNALHKPFAIYDLCEHEDHKPGDVGVLNIDEIGLTCNKLYDVCTHCCVDYYSQNEVCASYHRHGPDLAICSTAELLNA